MADGFDISQYLAEKAGYIPSGQDLAVAGGTAVDSALLGGPSAAAHLAGVDTAPFKRMQEESPNAAAAGNLASLGIMPGMKAMASGVGTSLMDMLFGGPAAAQKAPQAAGPFTTILQKDMARLDEVTSSMALQEQGDPSRNIKAGKGPNYRQLQLEKAELQARIQQNMPLAQKEAEQAAKINEINAQTGLTEADIRKGEAEAAQRKAGFERQLMIGGGGLAVGGLLGGVMGRLARSGMSDRAATINKFGERAGTELAKEPAYGSRGFDDLTNAVNEGYRASGSTAPFQKAQLTPAMANSDAAIGRALNETTGALPAKGLSAEEKMVAADRAAIEAPFESTIKDPKPSLMQNWGLPAALVGEGILTSKVLPDAVGMKEDSPMRDVATGVGQGSFYAAGASKLGQIFGKMGAITKVSPEAKIALASGRDKVARDLADVRSPQTLAKVNEGKIPPSPAVAKALSKASDDAAVNRISGAQDENMLRQLRSETERAKLTADNEAALTAAERARNERLRQTSADGLAKARMATQAYSKATKDALDHPEISKEVADWLKSKGGQLRQRVDTAEFNDKFRDKLGADLKAAQIRKLGERHSSRAMDGLVEQAAADIRKHVGDGARLPPMKNRTGAQDVLMQQHGISREEADRILVRAYRKAKSSTAKP